MSDFDDFTDEELEAELQRRKEEKILKANSKKALEIKFKEAVEQATKEINVHVKNAREELKKAVEISEKYGVPFYSDVSLLSQSYRPSSFDDKFYELNEEHDLMFELLTDGLPVQSGWQQSMIC